MQLLHYSMSSIWNCYNCYELYFKIRTKQNDNIYTLFKEKTTRSIKTKFDKPMTLVDAQSQSHRFSEIGQVSPAFGYPQVVN